MKEKKIVGINTSLYLNDNEKYSFFKQIDFDETISLYDYDVVVIDSRINFLSDEISRNKIIKGCNLHIDSVYKYQVIFDAIKKQLVDLLNNGKNIYVILDQYEKYFYKNQTKMLEFNVFSYLPINIEYEILIGDKFKIDNKEPYFSFFNSFNEYISYKNTIKVENINKVITLKNCDKCIAGFVNCGAGKIFFIPFFKQPQLPVFGYTGVDRDNRDEIFLSAIQKLEIELESNFNESLPDWTSEILILDENETKNDIFRTNQKILDLQNELTEQTNKLRFIQEYKYLLTSTGKTLENIVKKTLKEIGFSILETEENRSDVIAKYKNINIVAEIKGLTKSAAEKNAAQLEKWASEFMEEKGEEPKALLIVNGYYDLPLKKRKEAVFPNQMLRYAEKKEQCLLSTTQLLLIFLDIRNKPQNKDKIINELLNTVGVYNKYKVDKLIK